MKKLEKIKNLLSRSEMKQIQGGSGGSGPAYCYCKNGTHTKADHCAWCHNVCGRRRGYKGVCLQF